jgi:hypothetical protein
MPFLCSSLLLLDFERIVWRLAKPTAEFVHLLFSAMRRTSHHRPVAAFSNRDLSRSGPGTGSDSARDYWLGVAAGF